jgi:hypothetical protein
MDLKQQLQRIQIAAELLERASITKTKKAAKSLGDETLILLSGIAVEIDRLNREISELKAAN